MSTEHIIIAALVIGIFVLLGIVLKMGQINKRLLDYIAELERDYRSLNNKLKE